MPDRYSDPDPTEPPDDIWAAAERHRAAIDHCTLCDESGYIGTRVCDHRPHSTPETRAAARELLAKALKRGDS